MAHQPRPIVIVTGANGGVGYGICQRLLLQLSQTSTPSDSLPQEFAVARFKLDGAGAGAGEKAIKKSIRYSGVTLIMACRNMKRAEVARTKLLRWFDNELARMMPTPTVDDDASSLKSFRLGCDVQIAELDLARFSSVLKFAATMNEKLPYVSHVVFNAGLASFSHIDWWPCMKQFVKSPVAVLSAPTYNMQYIGETSSDGLGWVWQCNVFGHFSLYRELERLLSKTPFSTARVIWFSSLEASPAYFDLEDWQVLKSGRSYEASKYQIDLIATHLSRTTLPSPNGSIKIKHLICEPGICSTMIAQNLTGPVMDFFKILMFYAARYLGSTSHTITTFKAAIAAIHLILVPFLFISNEESQAPVRYGSRADWWGREYVCVSPVKEWASHVEESAALVRKCDALYEEMKRKAETASVVHVKL